MHMRKFKKGLKSLAQGLKRTKKARGPMDSTYAWYKQPQTEVQTNGTYRQIREHRLETSVVRHHSGMCA